MKVKNEKMNIVIAEYTSGHYKQTDLALRHKVCEATISNWLRKAGCPHGVRGRPALVEPPVHQQHLLREIWNQKITEVAIRHQVSKQFVSKLAKRWNNWADQNFGPRQLKVKPVPKTVKIKKDRSSLQLHVISFRVSDEALSKILMLRGSNDQFRGQSLHFVARELLLTGIGQGGGSALSANEPSHTDSVTSAN